MLQRVADACGYRTLADINPDRLNAYAADLRTAGRSARMVQKHLTAIKGFTRSLVDAGKLPVDPLATVRKPNPKHDRRHERRMLLRDEWEYLRDYVLAQKRSHHGMPASERVLLYSVAILTGLRANEIRSLTRANLHLDGQAPFITCDAASTKNGKPARQYIHKDVGDQLAELIASKAPKAPVFSMPHPSYVAAMLRSDVEAARKAWVQQVDAEREARERTDFLLPENHAGHALDFHSLRHTTGSWLAMTGAHPKAIQTIMRHSTIVLTMDAYGHLFPGQEADSIARVPSLMASNLLTAVQSGGGGQCRGG